MVKLFLYVLLVIIFGIIIFVILIIGANVIIHGRIFSRADGGRYVQDNLKYSELDSERYPRRRFTVLSGKNRLVGYIYGTKTEKGVIVVSCGHRCSAANYYREMMLFCDMGWQVVLYDYTGSFESEGRNIVGYVQAPKDLEAVFKYIQNEKSFANMPILLYGHSLGAYASAAVLQKGVHPAAVIAASGFSDPMEQWDYSVRRFSGFFGKVISPFTRLFMRIKFGKEAHFTAIDGINSVDIPVMILQGTDDEFYGKVSSIYEHRDRITNKKCEFHVMNAENKHGHYDYLLSDDAIQYRKTVNDKKIADNKIDRLKFSELDKKLFADFNIFLGKSLP